VAKNKSTQFRRSIMGLLNALLGNAGVVDPETLAKEYGKLLTEGEEIEIGFKLIRDVFIFTNKRLIFVDKQGITGKKTEYISMPYKSISGFSIRTAGHFDLNAELKIWAFNGQLVIERKFDKKVNIYDLQKVLAKHICS